MNWTSFLTYLAVMAGVTYLIRMLPMTIFRKPDGTYQKPMYVNQGKGSK